MTILRFDGAAKGAIEKIEVEITRLVMAGDHPFLIQPVLIGAADRLWLTIGAEGSIAREAWRFEEIEPHWDRLILRSRLAELGQPRDLIARWTGSKRLGVGVALFCGALSPAELPQPGQTVAATLEDPVLRRRLVHSYRVQSPPLLP